MSTKIGHFEIQSELSRSATGAVYKTIDPQNGQTVALKAIQLSAFGDRAAELEAFLLKEAETTRVLSHSNLSPVYGAGEIEGQFCAAMEYVQGNSVATMLARKEGFSIWDLLDIGRQVCSGLEHAHSHGVFHFSLEPAKIMCGWDGTVKILGYGVSGVGMFAPQIPGVPAILHYMSPEQVRGDEIDARANLFSLGAIFYEMVTDRKAFDGEDAESLRQSIVESTPVPPQQVNPKLHPALSTLIMKALAKNPSERHQNGRELLDDLERCKELKPQAAKQQVAAAAAASGAAVSGAAKAAVQAKFVGASEAPVARQAVAPQSRPAEVRLPASAPSAAPKAGAVVGSRPVMAAAASAIEAPQPKAPRIAVDPMMAEDGSSRGGNTSFSEVTELPPLKEAYVPPPPPPAFEPPAAASYSSPVTAYDGKAEKPKIQPREVAANAVKEIKNVPPRLMVYAIAGAAVLILIIAIALVLHVNNLNNDGDSPHSAAAESKPTPAPQVTQQAQAVAAPAEPSTPVAAAAPASAAAHGAARGKNARSKKPAAPVAPVAVPGQMAIDSTPQGAQVQVDGKTDPTWVTPFNLAGLAAGQHNVTVSKTGYISETKSVDVVSGGKSFVVTHLTQLTAALAVTSTPAGANVYVDGKDTGKLTPAQIPVDKGAHVVLVRKSGYIDETTSSQFILGQTVSFSPTLRSLGNVDDIRTVGKMKKLFGGKEAQGLGSVSVKTQPKGAQVAVNQHMLDKASPVDFVLDPGNYIVDITLTGFVPIHKVITVDKGGKAVIDEVMQHQ